MPNNDHVYKHNEDGSVERLVFEKTEDLLFDGHKIQSTLKRDIARARLQLAITQALCAYIEETNVPERVGLTQIDFEHHGARVSVKVEIGEVTPIQAGCQCGRCGTCKSQTNEYDTILAESHGMTLGQFRHLMRYHPTSGKGADEICQKREETLACNDPLHFERVGDGRELLKCTVMDESFHEHAEELRIELQREVNRLFFPSFTFSVFYHNVHSSSWNYLFRTKTPYGEYEYLSQELIGILEYGKGRNSSWVQGVARDVLGDFRKVLGDFRKRDQDESEVYNTLLADQKKMEEQLSSTNWRANSMYTIREDQERYGNG